MDRIGVRGTRQEAGGMIDTETGWAIIGIVICLGIIIADWQQKRRAKG